MGIVGLEVLARIKNVCLQDEARKTSMAVACRILGVNWKLVQREFPNEVFALAEELKAYGVTARLRRTPHINAKRFEAFEALVSKGETWQAASKSVFGLALTAVVAEKLGLAEQFERLRAMHVPARQRRDKARALKVPVTNIFLPELTREELEVLAVLSLLCLGWGRKSIAKLFQTTEKDIGMKIALGAEKQAEHETSLVSQQGLGDEHVEESYP
jgi:hypothetical protein